MLFTGAALAVTSPALAAPTPHDCATASEDAASLQKQEKLGAAKDRYLVCADAACPAEIREECGHRLSEVTDAIPSVVFDVKDAAGSDVSAVRVTMDGALLVDHAGRLRGHHRSGRAHVPLRRRRSVAVDREEIRRPGRREEPAPGGDARGCTVWHARLRSPPSMTPSPSPGAAPATSDQGTKSSLGTQKLVALIAGGAGIIGLGVGAVSGGKTFSSWSSAKSECATACGAGSQAQQDASTASTLATVSDVGFIAGGVLVAATAVLWFTAPSEHVQVTPTAGPQGAGLTIRGTF